MNNWQPNASMVCTCGYDLLRPTGYPGDSATCGTCSWEAAGSWAEHSGVHHWLDTGHHWTLRTVR